MHSWLCGYHQGENKSKIAEFTNKFKIKPSVNTNAVAASTKFVVHTAKVLKNMKRNLNISLAAKGALAHRLQHRTACEIPNGHQGAPKWQTRSGKVSSFRFLGILSNFC